MNYWARQRKTTERLVRERAERREAMRHHAEVDCLIRRIIASGITVEIDSATAQLAMTEAEPFALLQFPVEEWDGW